MSDQETLLEFPCEFPIKAMGRLDAGIGKTVFALISKHVPGLEEDNVKTRLSSNGKFVGVTINIVAQNREQLDAIYRELSEHPDVMYAL
jgi:putative lipoic acid-binding regulatory protein